MAIHLHVKTWSILAIRVMKLLERAVTKGLGKKYNGTGIDLGLCTIHYPGTKKKRMWVIVPKKY